MASLHPKAFSETDIREKPYVLPSLCVGCRGNLDVAQLRGFIEIDKDEGLGSEVESQEVNGEEDGEYEGQLVKESAIVSLPRSVCFGCALSKTPQ